MKTSITNYRLRATNLRRAIKTFVLVCALGICGAQTSAAQTNLDVLAEQIRRGNAEQKRDALFEIRKLKTAEASRLAIPALTDKSEIVRATAAFSVVFLPPDESLTVLLPLLKDKKELVRREAAYALGKTRNANAINALLQVFQTDKIGDVRNASIVALGDIGNPAAIDALTKIVERKPKENEEFTKRAAARSIGQIAQILQTNKTEVLTPEDFLPDEYKRIERPKYPLLSESFPVFRQAQNVLIRVLQNASNEESNDARREAAFALGAIGDAVAISVLQTNLTAEDYYLAQICREALRKIAVYQNAK